jgi:Uma2 family endonuclease
MVRAPAAGGKQQVGTRRLFTVDEYERMVAAGLMVREHVELIEGEVLHMAPMGTRHAACVTALSELLIKRVPAEVQVRVQLPVRVPERSEPEPDLALVRRSVDPYRARHPQPEDVFVLVEVSEISLAYDRDVKLPLYARAGIPEVWLVDLARHRILVHRRPEGRRYEEMTEVHRTGTVAPAAFPGLMLRVEDEIG